MQDLTLAIDLGGTNTKMALVDRDLHIREELAVETRVELGPDANMRSWLAVIKKWSSQIKAVGMGIPGPLDTERGMILESPNLKKWELFSFTKFFQTELGLSCFVENDANCATLGEWSQQRLADLVVLTLGTGVGSGVVTNNRLVRGAGGLAVEAGHMTIRFDGLPCNCGKIGCLEAYVGGVSFVRNYNNSLSDGMTKVQTPEEIFKRSQMHEKLAGDAVKQWTSALAVGTGSLINLFNPKKVIFTGGISTAFAQVKEEFLRQLSDQAFKHSLEYAEVEVSKLQNRAGLIGAALWAQQKNERANMSALPK